MIKHIMVPYDQSEPADRALEFATDIARKYRGAEISIVSCIVSQVPMDPEFGKEYAETMESIRQNASGALAKLESRLIYLKIPVKPVLLEGVSITEELLSYAESHGVDLIVMGSRGLGGY